MGVNSVISCLRAVIILLVACHVIFPVIRIFLFKDSVFPPFFPVDSQKGLLKLPISGLGLVLQIGASRAAIIMSKDQSIMMRPPSSGQSSLYDASSTRLHEASLVTPKDNALGRESGQTSSAASSIGAFVVEGDNTPTTSPLDNQRGGMNSKGQRCPMQHSALTSAIDGIGRNEAKSKMKGVRGVPGATPTVFDSFDQFVDVEEDTLSGSVDVELHLYQMQQERKAVEERMQLLEMSVREGSLTKTDASRAISQAAQAITAKNINALPPVRSESYPMSCGLGSAVNPEFDPEPKPESGLKPVPSRVESMDDAEYFPVRMSHEECHWTGPDVCVRKVVKDAPPIYVNCNGEAKKWGVEASNLSGYRHDSIGGEYGCDSRENSPTKGHKEHRDGEGGKLCSPLRHIHMQRKKRHHSGEREVADPKSRRSPTHSGKKCLPGALRILQGQRRESTPAASTDSSATLTGTTTRSRSSLVRNDTESEMMFDLEMEGI